LVDNLLLLKDKKILFAEDDIIMRIQISEVLEMLFGEVCAAADGEEAHALYEDQSPDLIITDIKMPKKDGLKLIQQIRRTDYSTPIILMTSFAEKEMLINAANLSIDGYLIKPVRLEMLTDAIAKAMKRSRHDGGLVKLGHEIYYNAGTKEVYRNGIVVALGGKELGLLALLISNRSRTVTKEDIARVLWPLDPVCESAIKNLILRIRKKLNADIIVSVRGVGYRLETREESDRATH
jgi:DNA-binding response OmpR family regulator